MLFKRNDRNTTNDPFMYNLKGVKVQVPESSVAELLKKGYRLYDPTWQPSEQDPINRKEPLKVKELKKMLQRESDTLEVIEI